MVKCKVCNHENTGVSFRCAGCGSFYETSLYEPKRKGLSAGFKYGGALAVLITLGVVLIGTYIYASPYIRLWQFRNAVINKEPETVSSFVDFPLLKQSLKDEMNAYMMAEMSKNKEGQDNPFSGLALLMGPAIVNNMIDAMVTPAGVERLFSGNLATDKKSNTPQSPPDFFNNPKVELGYHSLNEFWVIVLNPKNEKIALVLKRHWLGDWKLSGIRMPR